MNMEPNVMQQFAQRFNERAKRPRNLGRVGSKALAQLCKELGITETNQMLSTLGWVTPDANDGDKRIGSYKAGPEMDKISAQPPASSPPTNEYDYVKWLAAQKEARVQKKDEVDASNKAKEEQLTADFEARLAAIRAEGATAVDAAIADVDESTRAEQIVAQIDALTGSKTQ